jgi:hypothetical protein
MGKFINKECDFFYIGCPYCRKKVAMANNVQMNCINCNKSYTEPSYIYVFSLLFTDGTDTIVVKAFGEIADVIFGNTLLRI